MKIFVFKNIPALNDMRKDFLNYAKCIVILLIAAGFFSCEKQSSLVETDEEGEGLHIEPIIPITPLSDYSSIAFIARITENSADWSLCVMDKSGNNMRKIVDMTVACKNPVRSHYGERLLFSAVPSDSRYIESHPSFGEPFVSVLYIVNVDGTDLTQIDQSFTLFGCADWSPDDTQIVYLKYSDVNSRDRNLVIYNISDGTHTILQTEGDVCTPKFLPDGKYIAYCAIVENGHHIYITDVAGKNNQLLIRNAASPVWSPQGDKIAYSSSGEAGSSQIFVANVDGSNKKQLTNTVSPIRFPGWAPDGNGDPKWTPDGNNIVYVSWENGNPGIFIMNADGSKQTRLTTAEFRDEYPEITPDGKYILFSSRRSTNINMDGGIFIMDIDGKNQRALYGTGIHPIVCR